MDDFQIEIPLSRPVVALKMERVEYEPEQSPGLIFTQYYTIRSN